MVPKQFLGKGLKVPFENTEIVVLVQYENYLVHFTIIGKIPHLARMRRIYTSISKEIMMWGFSPTL